MTKDAAIKLFEDKKRKKIVEVPEKEEFQSQQEVRKVPKEEW